MSVTDIIDVSCQATLVVVVAVLVAEEVEKRNIPMAK